MFVMMLKIVCLLVFFLFIILDIILKVVLFNYKVGKMIDLVFKKFDILV